MAGRVKMVVADVDGTLLTSDKKITPATVEAVRKLRAAGIRFAVASARPPLGLRYLFTQLGVEMPSGAFNGALIVEPKPGLQAWSSIPLAHRMVAPLIDFNESFGLDTWLYAGNDWYVSDRDNGYVATERETVGMFPEGMPSSHRMPRSVHKIAGIGAPRAVAAAEAALAEEFTGLAHGARSQPFELDITHPHASKGAVIRWLADTYSLEREQIAVIGDGEVDIAMFAEAGTAIAMGNAPDNVKAAADHVTVGCDDSGFANAMERFVLA